MACAQPAHADARAAGATHRQDETGHRTSGGRQYGPVEGWTAQHMQDVAVASADCEARYRVEFQRWSSIRAAEQRTGEVGAAAAEATELFLGGMEGELGGAMGTTVVGEVALGPEEAEAFNIVVRRPQNHTKAKRQDSHRRRAQKRRLD